MSDTMLDIVNENDEVIGQALRSEIHVQGLLHREVNVFFITQQKEIIFQKRSMKKDTHPGLLMPTVGGHVELGETYEEAAIKEIAEEAGITLSKKQLNFLAKKRFDVFDPITQTRNNVFQMFFGVVYNDSIDRLNIEENNSDGFSSIEASRIFDLTPEEKSKIIPLLLEREAYGNIYLALQQLIS